MQGLPSIGIELWAILPTLLFGILAAIRSGFESNRLLIAAPDGKVAVEFTSRAENGKYYQPGWSRYIPQTRGDLALAVMKGVTRDE
ncbi:MAG: hypothetical protein U1E48_04915 [Paracoccaceae bacterium]